MNARFLFSALLIAALAAAGGWFAARRSHTAEAPAATAGRTVLYYQSPMHPWIKSDKPGNCTICGMKLIPVYEGEKGIVASADVVTLGTNTVTVIHVQTSEVKRRPLVRALRVAGRIDDNDAAHRVVAAYIDGRIDELAIGFVGAEVVEGQPLATFYSPPLLTAEREYLALASDLKARTPGGTLAVEQQSLLASAAQRLKRLGLADAQIRKLADKSETDLHTEILAPVSGTVVARFAYAGQYVKEGEKLFEIGDFSTMWFLFDAYERDLDWLRPGQNVEITVPSVPGRTFTAPIRFIDPNFNEATRTTRVRVELPNPLIDEGGAKRRLFSHRIYADAVVRAETPEALVVPRAAVLSSGTEQLVYVDLGGGSYQRRTVKLGRAGDDMWEVLDGLKQGERVVSAGNLLIDAQSQLNQGGDQDGHSAGHATAGSSDAATALPKLTDAQRKAAREFLAAIDAVGRALANDSLEQFNSRIEKLHTVLPALARDFADAGDWKTFAGKLNTSGHLSPALDLPAARRAFLAVSDATTELALALRRVEPPFAGLKIFQCPMTGRAFPGAPKTGRWMQLEAPVRNPYFGAEMIDCGTEVAP
jgi:Cu(I)/Ag(I) efflux system membrane fusion protein